MSESFEDVVITGVSCRLPESDNMAEFWEHLVAGDDMTTSDNRRWEPGLFHLPKREGKLKDITKFDAEFFGVHPKQANVMDPQLRMLLEVAYEAIVDSGYNPETLAGSRTGVFMGVSSSDVIEAWDSVKSPSHSGYSISGTSRAMIANRLSFCFDFKGPSYTVDTACSSSLMALHQAAAAIRSGECDSAIVGGSNICVNPGISLCFLKLGVLAPDGRCKSFDASADGYCRSEGIVAVHLQKLSSARRVYCSLVHSKTLTNGYTEDGIVHSSEEVQKQLLVETYQEAGLDPRDVDYVEAHGTGTQAGDTAELNAITDVFCEQRRGPVLVGSTKSNMGHPEGASGLAALAKVILALENGILPANLHYKNPNPNVPALVDGRLKVVTENTAWKGTLAAISSFGFGGANVHVILKATTKEPITCGSLPTCIISGRTEDCVRNLLTGIQQQNEDQNLVGLLREQRCLSSNSFPYRGYSVRKAEGNITEIKKIVSDNRPVWFVFSGMGSQWTGMGSQMMNIERFRQSILASDSVVRPHGVDLVMLLTDKNTGTVASPVESFVGIVSIQIALVNTLHHMGITPDGIVGHSVGELTCAYADGCLTSTEALLTAYWRGRCIQEADLPPGAMAAIGLSWKEVEQACPAGVAPACHNSADSVTVSGHAQAVSEFVQNMKEKGIFAKEVETSGIAFHSNHLYKVAPVLKTALDKIIEPKPRSSKWISSSIPETNWMSPLAQYSSSDYHVNNLVSPVLFHEALQHVPDNAIVLEIAPHCLLQAILKRSLPFSCHNAGLMSKKADDGLAFFYSSLGKCYLEGLNFNPQALSEPVRFPVPSGTPMISQYLRWDHSETWNTPQLDDFINTSSTNILEFDISPGSKDHFLTHHRRDGSPIFPASGYAVMAWQVLAERKGLNYEQFPVEISDLVLHQATLLSSNGKLKFEINIVPVTGFFEITQDGELKATGTITEQNGHQLELCTAECVSEEELLLTEDDVYKILKLAGFDYGPEFHGILKASFESDVAMLSWKDNWIIFLDLMVQQQFLLTNDRMPSKIRRIRIDPILVNQAVFTSVFNKDAQRCKCGGVEIEGLEKIKVPRLIHHSQPLFGRFSFVPHYQTIGRTSSVESEKPSTSCSEEASSRQLPRSENFRDSTDSKLQDGHTQRQFPKHLFDEQVLSASLGIVLDNCPQRCLHVLEISGSGDTVYSKIKGYLRNRADTEIQYTLANSQDQEHDGVSHMSWDLKTKYEFRDPPNLIILTSPFDGQSSVNTTLSAAVEYCLPQGFLLLLTPVASLSVNAGLFNLLENGAIPTMNHRLFLDSKSWNDIFLKHDLEVISEKTDGSHYTLFVLRKRIPIEYDPTLVCLDDFEYNWVETVKRSMASVDSGRLWLYSTRSINGLIGMIKCLDLEPHGDRVRCIVSPDPISRNSEEFQTIQRQDLRINVKLHGAWGSYSSLPLPNDTSDTIENVHLDIQHVGDLSTLRWIQSNVVEDTETNICRVHYGALNFRDVMLATGKLPADAMPSSDDGCSIGMEFSGILPSGKRVMGILSEKAMATTVIPNPQFLWEVPESWSLEEAATVPVVYATAYYALVHRGRITRGDVVLIHSGSGGVGQAAISLALHYGCMVYTTVSSKAKKEYLMKKFPTLKEKNFSNSRDGSFEDHILQETEGKGVDVILNSLSGDLLKASLRILAPHGRFLEIGKFDLAKDTHLGMSLFLKNTSFHGIHLDSLFDASNKDWSTVHTLVQEGLQSGLVRPLPSTTYLSSDVEEAFRYMSRGTHIGKVVIKVRSDCGSILSVGTHHRKTYLSPNKSYVLVGGLGGFGLELTKWLVDRGASKIVLSSRSGVRTGYQSFTVQTLQKAGVSVVIATDDVRTEEGTRKLLDKATVLAPLGGVFNLAAVLKNALMENQTQKMFQDVCDPKIKGTVHLDALTRCPPYRDSLDQFVVFSSLITSHGVAGSANYGFANSVMERIVEQRHMDSLPGTAIQWGSIDDVGLLVEVSGTKVLAGTEPQKMHSCIQSLDRLLNSPYPVVSCFVPDANDSVKSAHREADVMEAVGRVLGIADVSNLNKEVSLIDMGLDSLMGVEIQQLLKQNTGKSISIQEVREMNFAKLRKLSYASDKE